MKKLALLLLLASISCNQSSSEKENDEVEVITEQAPVSETDMKQAINASLEKWHKAAADANFEEYFGLMTEDGVFIGTDATENWQNKEFREFAKPYFDKGKAWNFTTLERTIYPQSNSEIAWFDELLNTQMGICRGSGVMEQVGDTWKVKHYVLSIAIPNDNVTEVTALKKQTDSLVISTLQNKQ